MFHFLTTRITVTSCKMAVLLIVLLPLLIGCSTKFDDLVRQKTEGISFVYPVNEQQALDISRRVFLKKGARNAEIEESKSDHTINWVGVLVVTIEPLDRSNTRITVTQPPGACSPTTPLITEKQFHDNFSDMLNLMKPATLQ